MPNVFRKGQEHSEYSDKRGAPKSLEKNWYLRTKKIFRQIILHGTMEVNFQSTYINNINYNIL